MKRYLSLASIILSGLLVKAILLFWDVFPFNADEAIVGLMARHILMGERPIFFYGQAYMGSLDAFLVAGFFKFFGQSVSGIRFVQVILYLFTILTCFWVGNKYFGSFRAGLVTALLLAIPPVNTTLYTTVSLGGYGEALLIGNLILITTFYLVRNLQENLEIQIPKDKDEGNNYWELKALLPNGLIRKRSNSNYLWLLWGFLSGFGLWVNGLTLVYSIPTGIGLLVLAVKCKKLNFLLRNSIFLFTGLFAGSLPWWIFAYQNGLDNLIHELFGAAVAVENDSFWMRSINHVIYFLILGMPAAIGLRPPWDIVWLGLPLIPFVLLIWGRVLWEWIKLPRSVESRLIEGVVITFVLGFVFTSFGVDPSGRYFLPIWVVMSLVAGKVVDEFLKKTPASWGLVGLIALFNLWGNVQCAISNPPGLTTQFYAPARIDMSDMPRVIQHLRDHGELRGYSNYWVSYPLAFLTKEEIIYSPRLPYHLDLRYTDRDDRYPRYTREVEESSKVAIITTHNPLLDERMRGLLRERKIEWDEKRIGDFQIYYNLSRPIRIVDFEPLFIQTSTRQ